MLFGNLTIRPDLYPDLYEKFSPEDITKSNKNHTGTNFDHAMNYVFGVYLCFVTLTSIILNPYLIIANLRKKPSLAVNLFILLEVIDFVTNLAFPIDAIIALFDPELHPAFYRDIPIGIQMISYVFSLTIDLTGCASSALAVSRFMAIVHPFVPLRPWWFYLGMFGYSCLFNLTTFYSAFGFLPVQNQDHIIRYRFCRNTFEVNPKNKYSFIRDTIVVHTIRICVSILGVLPGVICSILTIAHLLGRPKPTSASQRNARRGAMSIGAMNFMSVLLIVAKTLEITFRFTVPYVTFVSCVVIPVSLSTFNPLVCFLSGGRRQERGNHGNHGNGTNEREQYNGTADTAM